MAKEAPVIAYIIDDNGGSARTISNDYTNGAISTPRDTFDITGADKAARERLLGLADFSATDTGIFNDASNMSHAVFKTIPSTSVTRTYSWAASGQTLAPEALLTDYQLTRGADSLLTWQVTAELQSGTAPSWS
jgi:hypothetical protein